MSLFFENSDNDQSYEYKYKKYKQKYLTLKDQLGGKTKRKGFGTKLFSLKNPFVDTKEEKAEKEAEKLFRSAESNYNSTNSNLSEETDKLKKMKSILENYTKKTKFSSW